MWPERWICLLENLLWWKPVPNARPPDTANTGGRVVPFSRGLGGCVRQWTTPRPGMDSAGRGWSGNQGIFQHAWWRR